MNIKICSTCKESKQVTEFSKNKSRYDGLQASCKNCRIIICKKYREHNKEKIAENKKKWQQNNKDKRRVIRKKYEQANPAKTTARKAKRRAQKLQATPKWLTKQDFAAIREWYRAAKQLEKETGKKFHVDHIIPLRGRNVCGLHVPNNLQVITAIENVKKGNKYGLE